MDEDGMDDIYGGLETDMEGLPVEDDDAAAPAVVTAKLVQEPIFQALNQIDSTTTTNAIRHKRKVDLSAEISKLAMPRWLDVDQQR